MSKPSLVRSTSGLVAIGGGTFTVDCTGADFLVVKLAWANYSQTPPTINGTAMSVINAVTSGYQSRLGVYYLASPTQGVNTVSVVGESTDPTTYVAEAWSGVDQTTPYGDNQTAGGTSTYPVGVTLTTVTSNDIIDAMFYAGINDGTSIVWDQTTTSVAGTNTNGGSYSSVLVNLTGGSIALNATSGPPSVNHRVTAYVLKGASTSIANGIPSLTLRDKNGTLMTAGTSVSVTVDTTTGTNVYPKTALSVTSANQIPVIDLSSAVTAGTIAVGDTVNYRVDYGGETTIVPQTVVASPT